MSADAERARFIALLERAASEGRTVKFWWRDDDAVEVTPHLETMTALQARYDVPLALAVIPKTAERNLAIYLEEFPGIAVFQHGFEHRNHADKKRGERAGEFPRSRPLEDNLAALGDGFDRLSELFGDRFLPVLTPPWNRVSKQVRQARQDTGLVGLSAYGRHPGDDPHQINAHVDILRWKGGARFAGRLKCYRSLIAQTRMRLAGLNQPVGLLTHHLVHDEAANAFLDEILHILTGHEAVRWPALTDLFGIEDD